MVGVMWRLGRLSSILIASSVAATGCKSIGLPEPRMTAAQCTTDAALVGTWTDARMTQLGPAWIGYTLRDDCSFTTIIQLLWIRITERGQYRADGGRIYFERASGQTIMPYRVENDHLQLTESTNEIQGYRRR